MRLPTKTCDRLVRLRNEAERDGAWRVATRLRAVILNSSRDEEPSMSFIHAHWHGQDTHGM